MTDLIVQIWHESRQTYGKRYKRSDANRYVTEDLVNRDFERDGPNQL